MVKRSLQASLTAIQEAKSAFALKGWTQDNLAAEVNLKTRQPIWRFFSGRPVERHTDEDFAHIYACGDALSSILGVVLDVGLYKSLQQLSDEFPDSRQSQERFGLWWQTNYSTWAEQLKTTVINYRNINHQWEFSIEQQQVLQRYYDANQLLLDCLDSNCEATLAIRQEIEANLLLPQKELEDREWE
ncbi:NACHT C-terminal helical domain 2-containing protein [Nostoc sp.]|uniref:NACHT C-terminal helical domain 2-containing protein n=1 Tax=Nostoc sp. TaxID=1180 RepID=UPI002FF6809B